MNNKTTITRALAVYIACLILLLTSCNKGLSDRECQYNYDRIVGQYTDKVKSATDELIAHLITEQQFNQLVRNYAAQANTEARNLDGCCCWRDL